MDVKLLRCVECGTTFSITDERGQPVDLTDDDLAALLDDFGCPECAGDLRQDDA